MIIPGSGVSGIAHVGDRFTLSGEVPFRQPLGITIQVRIVKNESAVTAQLIDGGAAPIAVKEFNDGAVRRGNDRGSERRGNIDRVMDPPFCARVRKRVAQLIGPHTGDRNNQLWRRAGKRG